MKKTGRFFVALALFAISAQARAAVTFEASGNGVTPTSKLKASVVFAVSNSDLVVTISNLGTFDPSKPEDILTALFFEIPGDPKLTPLSATLVTDSSVLAFPLPVGFNGDVSGEWAYRNDLVGAPEGDDEGISTVNLKWFGNKKYDFPGENISHHKQVGGINFGLTTMNDMPGNNKGQLKNSAVIDDSVQFVFALPADFNVNLDEITDPVVQYGSNLKEAHTQLDGEPQTIPEPSSIMLVAAGLAGVLGFMRRKSGR